MVTMKKSVTMEAVKSLLLEWDGDGSGLEAVETAGGTLYKVADVIVQNEDIPGMTVTDSEGKETLVTDSIYNDMISRSLVGDGFAAKVAGYVYLAQKAAQAPGAELPAGGIWLLKKQDGSYPKKVVLPAYREAFLQGEKPDGEKGESMGGGATSWNDLTDKPFWEEVKLEEVLPNTEITADQMSNGQTFFPTFPELMEGCTYVVNLSGVAYERKGTLVTQDGVDLIMLGSAADPFMLVRYPASIAPSVGFECMAIFLDETLYDGFTFSIMRKDATVKTIDPKFLPQGSGGEVPFFDLVEMGLPVVTVGKMVNAEIDTTPIVSAAEKTPVRIRIRADLYNDGSVMEFYKIINLCAIPVAGAAVTGENLFSDVVGGDDKITSASIFVLDLVFNPSGVRAAVIRQTIL